MERERRTSNENFRTKKSEMGFESNASPSSSSTFELIDVREWEASDGGMKCPSLLSRNGFTSRIDRTNTLRLTTCLDNGRGKESERLVDFSILHEFARALAVLQKNFIKRGSLSATHGIATTPPT